MPIMLNHIILVIFDHKKYNSECELYLRKDGATLQDSHKLLDAVLDSNDGIWQTIKMFFPFDPVIPIVEIHPKTHNSTEKKIMH